VQLTGRTNYHVRGQAIGLGSQVIENLKPAICLLAAGWLTGALMVWRLSATRTGQASG
jgi:predicted chitinase